ncbi:major facilitator superfamily protein [Actinidia rufa]|uniref:Major facilitator superfamily protein n=1 Tax=Actinidia rufa TaxID=165716 RepID=A0A7J0DYX8_9ERIC|nr:major facilitator superfamily protein [Actinidia rufa]
MAVSGGNACEASTPLLDDGVDGVVDYKNRPVLRSKSGAWRSAIFIIGVEVAERCAYYGIGSNLITYLTGPLGQSTATAAENVNAWSGAASLLPLFGAFVADSFLGRYRTIIIASVLYILGLGLLTLSAVLPSFSSSDCESDTNVNPCSPPELQIVFFFFSLYLVAVAQGGHKPCVQAFGADQFDAQHPQEYKAKSSFFNWWYFALCLGSCAMLLILNYIQDNLNWVLGFGIPCIVMAFALVVFLLGTTTYRFSIKSDEKGPFVRIGRVFVNAAKNWRTTLQQLLLKRNLPESFRTRSIRQFLRWVHYRFLDKAMLAPDGSKEDGKVCSINEVEEAKAVLRLVPIWTACLVYAIVFAQSSTLFTKQGVTLDRSIGSGFAIPAASLQSFITLVEKKRLEIAIEYGLVDKPKATVPMSFWWLVPQYILFGIGDVFTMVGLQEFFYDQMPSELKSVGLSLYLSIFGVGSFLSSFLISVVENITGGDGQDSWFSDNLNRAHIDYFYWLLAGLSAVGLVAYLYFAKSYIYNRGSTI